MVVFNRSYLEIEIFKQSHFFTVHQKHHTLSSHINILTMIHPDFFLMISQMLVVLLSDLPCIMATKKTVKNEEDNHAMITPNL